MAYTVEFYLQRYHKRVASICQWEAQRKGLDFKVIHREATQLALDQKSEYSDSLGTNGFVRWFTNLASTLCTYYRDHDAEYSKVLNRKKSEPTMTEEPQEQKPGKHCSKCDSTKGLDAFYNNRSKSDGKSDYCKECMKALMKNKPAPAQEVNTTVYSGEKPFKITAEETALLIQHSKAKLEVLEKEVANLRERITIWEDLLKKLS